MEMENMTNYSDVSSAFLYPLTIDQNQLIHLS